jgi:hypothetical protein
VSFPPHHPTWSCLLLIAPLRRCLTNWIASSADTSKHPISQPFPSRFRPFFDPKHPQKPKNSVKIVPIPPHHPTWSCLLLIAPLRRWRTNWIASSASMPCSTKAIATRHGARPRPATQWTATWGDQAGFAVIKRVRNNKGFAIIRVRKKQSLQ